MLDPHQTRGQKRTFFCRCGFEGDMHDDFIVDTTIDTLEYICPNCSACVTERPRSEN